MKKLIFGILITALSAMPQGGGTVAGKWQLALETDHGNVSGPLELKQDGSKLSGTFDAQEMGKVAVTGEAQGPKISLTLAMHGGEFMLKLTGTVDAGRMSGGFEGIAGKWSASRALTGTVTGFKPDSLEIGFQPDQGEAMFLKVGAGTQVVRVAPGERDLAKAAPAKVTDILKGDRLLATPGEGAGEARRLVLVAADDIARRNEQERADWARRGISGIVAAHDGDAITLETRTSSGAKTTRVLLSGATVVRRYAPDSVKFTDALPDSAAGIRIGDQVKLRGERKDESTVAAEEIVYGTFVTSLGTIRGIDRDGSTIRLEDLATKQPVTVRITADSRIRLLPGMAPGQAGEGHGGGGTPITTAADLMAMFERLPAVKTGDLKVGGSVILTSTRGAKPGEVTAILMLANADMLVEMAQATAAGEKGTTAVDVIGRLHGGMFGGPGGLSLPAMLQ